jgi:putative ABC transport system substrate-binding protein
MNLDTGRRAFVTLLGAAATSSALLPHAARAQSRAMPVVGFLNGGSPGPSAHYAVAFEKGLRETGYVPGRNATLELRWAGGANDQLPALAADLVRRRVAVIAAAGGYGAALAAKAATSTIPIVFAGGGDPVQVGLVASLNRPGGNATGVTHLAVEVGGKRLQLLRNLIPSTPLIAVLVNPGSAESEVEIQDVRGNARTIGQDILILSAGTEEELERAFASLAQHRAGALFVGAAAYFNSRRDRIIALAERYKVPAIYDRREFTAAGGLISYGNQLAEGYRQIGIYAGRILNGEKPADLPVVQASRFEMVINLRTAKTLNLEIPASLLALSDEVIE